MIDTGYLFSKDDKRIFVNTCLGCTCKCSYCYLSKMGYNKSIVSKIKKAEELVGEIEQQRDFKRYFNNFRMFLRMLG